MSIVASGYTRSASRLSTTRANAFPTMLSRDILRYLLQSQRSPLFLYSTMILAFPHVLWCGAFLPSLEQEVVQVAEWGSGMGKR